VTALPNQIYFVGTLLLIPYTKFKIYPEGYFDTTDYRLYSAESPPDVSNPLEFETLHEADSNYLTLN